jgi:hypothetical protein
MKNIQATIEISSKRRRGFPSETQVKRGARVVHGNKELIRKARPQRPLPLRFNKTIQELLYAHKPFRRHNPRSLHPVSSSVVGGSYTRPSSLADRFPRTAVTDFRC